MIFHSLWTCRYTQIRCGTGYCGCAILYCSVHGIYVRGRARSFFGRKTYLYERKSQCDVFGGCIHRCTSDCRHSFHVPASAGMWVHLLLAREVNTYISVYLTDEMFCQWAIPFVNCLYNKNPYLNISEVHRDFWMRYTHNHLAKWSNYIEMQLDMWTPQYDPYSGQTRTKLAESLFRCAAVIN